MRLLLDTHVALWALTAPSRLSEAARALIRDPGNTIFISAVSAWEVALKNGKSPDRAPMGLDEFLLYCRRSGYRELPLGFEHISKLCTIDRDPSKPIHHDPFDRILLCQAQHEGMLLLTHDRKLLRYSPAQSIFDVCE